MAVKILFNVNSNFFVWIVKKSNLMKLEFEQRRPQKFYELQSCVRTHMAQKIFF